MAISWAGTLIKPNLCTVFQERQQNTTKLPHKDVKTGLIIDPVRFQVKEIDQNINSIINFKVLLQFNQN